jgi:uncharacterized membrane protein YdjX (TVP38/TMEM64 family)
LLENEWLIVMWIPYHWYELLPYLAMVVGLFAIVNAHNHLMFICGIILIMMAVVILKLRKQHRRHSPRYKQIGLERQQKSLRRF